MFIESKSLLPDSGGAGAARGGLGQRMRMRNDSGTAVSISCFSGRTDFGAEGFAGGSTGKLRRYWINEQLVPSKKAYQLAPGDILMTEEAGGGGFGPPAERSDALLLSDLRAGFVTAEGLVNDWKFPPERVAALIADSAKPA
jgi:N-methylhydantoinase B